VPAYNEVNGIGVTLAEAIAHFANQPYDVEVIVVADGTTVTRKLVQSDGAAPATDSGSSASRERRGKAGDSRRRCPRPRRHHRFRRCRTTSTP